MDQSGREPVSRRGQEAVGRRIYEQLRGQIVDGTLAPEGQMPSTRAVAAELGVSRTTVTAVYEQLAAEGFIVTACGRVARVAFQPAPGQQPRPVRRLRTPTQLSAFGRRVAAMELPTVPSSATGPGASLADFLYGAVSSHDFPVLAWRRAHQSALLRRQNRLYYAEPEGDPGLRESLQGYLQRARGLRCDARQIVIVQGSQQAIDLCARLHLDAGDAFAFEDPGYGMARRCFEATGARLRPIPVDEHGLVTTALPDDPLVRLAYVTPSHQFPLGGVLPIARRIALLDWARRRRAWIVEDDYDGEFRYGQHPIDALQSIDSDDRVIYIGTFSKALSPQIRLGYLVLPPALVPVYRQAKQLADRHAPLLDQRVLAALIDSGAYERHVRRVRRENERRRTALLAAVGRHLPDTARITGTSAGLHVVLWLPGWRPEEEAAVIAAAAAQGVGLYPLSPLFAGRSGARTRPAGFIVGYASLAVEDIDKGVSALADVTRHLGRGRRSFGRTTRDENPSRASRGPSA